MSVPIGTTAAVAQAASKAQMAIKNGSRCIMVRVVPEVLGDLRASICALCEA